MTRKRKLEAGLQNLFSARPASRAERVSVVESAPVTTTPGPVPTIAQVTMVAAPPVESSATAAPVVTEQPIPPAKPQAEALPTVGEEQLVVLRLGDEHYAINIEAVESIIKLQTITAVPRAPKCVDGLTNLRGDVLLVVDLRTRLGFDRVTPTPNSRIVVCNWKGHKLGMLVDGVSEVARINRANVEPPSPIVVKMDTGFVRGIAKAEDRLMVLLDLERVLNLN